MYDKYEWSVASGAYLCPHEHLRKVKVALDEWDWLKPRIRVSLSSNPSYRHTHKFLHVNAKAAVAMHNVSHH